MFLFEAVLCCFLKQHCLSKDPLLPSQSSTLQLWSGTVLLNFTVLLGEAALYSFAKKHSQFHKLAEYRYKSEHVTPNCSSINISSPLSFTSTVIYKVLMVNGIDHVGVERIQGLTQPTTVSYFLENMNRTHITSVIYFENIPISWSHL